MNKHRRKSTERRENITADPTAAAQVEPAVRRISGAEWVIVGICLLMGIGLRLMYPDRMAVEHFDEGVYASNLWFGLEQGYHYPLRQFYAPPLLPACIEWTMMLAGTGPVAVMATSLFAGCASIALSWYVARDWFGPAAGFVALAIIALSDMHALYSRTALTDVMLLTWCILALWLLWQAIAGGDYRFAVMAGIVTGLSWLTKYNGWLPLAVAAAALPLWWVVFPASRRSIRSQITAWCVAAAIAGVMFAVYIVSLPEGGGYAAITAHHRTYVTGFAHWWRNTIWQLANMQQLDGGLSVVGLATGLLVATGWAWRTWPRTADVRDDSRPRPATLLIIVALAELTIAAATIANVAVACLVWAVVGMLVAARPTQLARLRTSDDPSVGPSSLAACFVAAMIAGLTFATPLYHPYPRLTLPWQWAVWMQRRRHVRAGCLADPTLVERRIHEADATRDELEYVHARVTLAATAVLIFFVWSQRERLGGVAAWQDRSGLRRVAQRIAEELPRADSDANPSAAPPNESILLVYGEPALLFHLRAAGFSYVTPVAHVPDGDKVGDPLPLYLITGPHAMRDSQFVDELASSLPRLESVAIYRYEPSLLVRLNHGAPTRPSAERSEIRIYRVR
ncbi:MAG: glycosyltransferase family 39 protein [Pirellulaceae bacterium]